MKHNTTLVELCFRTSRNFPSFQGKTVPSHASKTGIYDPQSHRSIPKIKDETAASQKFAYLEAKSLIDIFRCDLFWSSNWSTFFLNPPLLLGNFPYFVSSAWIPQKIGNFPSEQPTPAAPRWNHLTFAQFRPVTWSWALGNWKGLEGLMVGKVFGRVVRKQHIYPPGFFGNKTILKPVILGEWMALTVQKLLHWKDHLISCQLLHTLCSPNEALTSFELFFWKFEASSYSSFRHLNPHKFLPTLKWTSALVSRQFTRK